MTVAAVLGSVQSVVWTGWMQRQITRLVLALAALGASACDDGPPPAPTTPSVAVEPDPFAVHISGSGAMTPAAAQLSLAWSQSHPELRVVVEPSVGSTGGIRAAADGAVDVGMVARPLTDKERDFGLRAVWGARDAVVLAVHPSVSATSMSSDEFGRLLAGESVRFADGSPAVVLLRDRDDSAHAALERCFPALRALRENAYDTRRFRVLLHDDTMGEALVATPGAIGVFSLGTILSGHMSLKVLTVDGVSPSVATMEAGTWKATRDLAFVVRADRVARVQPFLTFVRGPVGERVLREGGYLPIKGSDP